MSRLPSTNVLFTRLGFDKRYLLSQPTFTIDLCRLYVNALAKRIASQDASMSVSECYIQAIFEMADEVAELLVCAYRIAPEKQADASMRYSAWATGHFKKELANTTKPVQLPAPVKDEPAPWDETPVVEAPKAKAKRTNKQVLQPALISC